MKRIGASRIMVALVCALCVLAIVFVARVSAREDAGRPAQTAAITIDYPLEGSIFPPEFPAPTFIWRDDEKSTAWLIEVTFAGHVPGIKAKSKGERMKIGEIDPRCVAKTNEPPALTAEQAAAHTWTPDPETWATIKKHSSGRPATVAITGFTEENAKTPVSQGRVSILTSKDPVGAPIFYRDVPLMPSEGQRGFIKPLAAGAVPLIAWRLRDVSQPRSRILMEGLHTCANCHSFSADGKTMGMDVDGPQNDKGLYALTPVKSHTSIRNEDVIAWSSYQGKLGGKLRVGFMSQVSPDGQYVVTTINDPGLAQTSNERRRHAQDMTGNYYVTNFKDYRFLQVFYPTRGILAWYSRRLGRLQPLPGADDPRYVHTNAVWSRDGKFLVFARAEAKDAYPPSGKMAEYANDPNETPIQYGLYRIAFNEGRGGQPEQIRGASENGVSNSFPKISPDGRWVVFVQCRNGQLMRPDGQLYIVPFQGGAVRRMRCNTPLMNSWHSFSPNGRWLVFSSKSRSPYTQMFLTHLDEQGQDSPAILIENSTAANRAVNLPEFVNTPPDAWLTMDAPATEFYRVFDLATELGEKRQYKEAAEQWRKALELNSQDVRVYNNLGVALAAVGDVREATSQYEKAFEVDPDYAEAYKNLALTLTRVGKLDQAIVNFEKALLLDPEDSVTHSNLGAALIDVGRMDEAVMHCRKALEIDLGAEARVNLAIALAKTGKLDEAISDFDKALEAKPDSGRIHLNLAFALLEKGRAAESIAHFEKALAADPDSTGAHRYLARLLAEAGRFDEAIPHFESALAAEPNSAELHYNLARLLSERGKLDESVAHFQRVFELAPRFAAARYDLGNVLYSLQGKTGAALEQWRKALEIEPDHLPALNRLARVLAASPDDSVRNGPEAVVLAERAVELSGGRDVAILDTLAAAYAGAGRFDNAVKTARRAQELATGQNNSTLAAAIGSRIALYEAHSALREER